MPGLFVCLTNKIASVFRNQVVVVSHIILLSTCIFNFKCSIQGLIATYHCLLFGTQGGNTLLVTLALP